MTTVPTNITNIEIQEIGDRLGMQFRDSETADTVRTDLDSLLRAIGATVSYCDSQESSQIDSNGNFHIFLPNMTSARRDRFTVAHELGHYFLHYILVRKPDAPPELVSFGRGERNRAETQANVFASALLMPKQLFRRAFNDNKQDIFSIAQAFGVSTAAANVRAQVLGLE